jgi:transcriptional regulator with XRE-family HTH domain
VKEKVSFRIRKLRESKDYSQENMANDLNITPSAYSKIERGVTDPSVGRLAEIAKILGVDIIYFFQEENTVHDHQEKNPPYGFATKNDLEELNAVIKELKKEISMIRKELKPGKSKKN